MVVTRVKPKFLVNLQEVCMVSWDKSAQNSRSYLEGKEELYVDIFTCVGRWYKYPVVSPGKKYSF